MSSAEKIKRLFAKSTITVHCKVDDRMVRDALTAFDGSEEVKSISAGPHLRRITMKARITKYAAAAAIIITVLVGIHLLDGSPDGSGVAWAEVAKNMEAIHSDTCRMTSWQMPVETPDGTESEKKEVSMRFWYSDEYGFKMEQYSDGELSLIVCMLRESNDGLRVWPKDKKYLRVEVTEEERAIMNAQEMDPREWVHLFLATNYTSLGQDVVDGDTVEGVEVNEPGALRKSSEKSPIEDYVARIWVDVESELPVRLEEEYTYGSVRGGGGADQFQWNVEISAADLEPDIPDDYTLLH